MQSKIICKFLRLFERGTFTCPGVTFMCPGDYDDEGGTQICALGSHFCAPGSSFCAPGGLVRFSVVAAEVNIPMPAQLEGNSTCRMTVNSPLPPLFLTIHGTVTKC